MSDWDKNTPEKEVWVETEGVWLNRVFYLQPGRYRITRWLDDTENGSDAPQPPRLGRQ